MNNHDISLHPLEIYAIRVWFFRQLLALHRVTGLLVSHLEQPGSMDLRFDQERTGVHLRDSSTY